ncbi:ribonuclease H-like domain-containing protein [Tanacetum coccineum]
MQKTVLKQQYENFTASRSEGLDKIYDRFQKLISQLEIQGEVISQEDANLKSLRSLPPAWNNIALIMRNKPDLDELSMDDLYNNLKVYEAEIKSQSSSNSNSQNVAFVSSENTSSTNEAVNTALDVSTASTQGQASSSTYADDVMFSFFVNQSKSPLLDNEDMEQIDSDDLEEMDLKWQVAMLTIRIKRFMKKTQRNLNLNGKEAVGLDMTKVECYNYHRKGHFARDCRAPRNQGNRNGDNVSRRVVPVETPANALVVQDGIGLESLEARIVVHEKNEASYEESIAFLKYDVQVKDISIKNLENQLEEASKEKDDLKFKLEKFEESSKNLTKLINSQISVKDKTGLGFDSYVNESEVLNNVVDSHDCDQVNDRFKKSEGYHAVPPPYTRNFKPARADLSFAGLDNSVYKSKVSETITSVPNVETTASKTSKDSLEKPKTVRPSAPIIEDWESDSEDENVFKPKEVKKTVKSSFEKIEFVKARNSTVEKPRNSSQNPRDNKINENRREFAPTAILTKSGIVPISATRQSSLRAAAPASAARSINTDVPKPFVNVVNSVNTAKVNSVNTAKGNKVTSAVGEQGINVGNPQYALQDQGIFDSGCSRHMTGNKFYLSDYQDIGGGFVAFGGSSKGGKITGKGKIRTGKIDFEDTECLVLSPDFKLLDESQMSQIDGKAVVISESSVISDLLFNDEDGIACLTNDKNFENLALMGYEQLSTKLTFQKGDRLRRQDTTLGGADAQTRSETASKTSYDPPLSEVNTSRRGEDSMEYHNDLMDVVPPTPYDSPLSRGNIPGSDEGRMELIQELMETCTSLTKRVLALEEAKTGQDRVITRLKLRVKRLEKKRKERTPQPMKRRLFKGRVENSTDKSTANLQDTGIFGNAYDDEDVGAEADLNNLETTMSVSPIPTTRIYKDHPKEQMENI